MLVYILESYASVGTNRLFMLSSNALVVRSIDFIIILSVGVMGEFAAFKGLKFRMADIILFAMAGRE